MSEFELSAAAQYEDLRNDKDFWNGNVFAELQMQDPSTKDYIVIRHNMPELPPYEELISELQDSPGPGRYLLQAYERKSRKQTQVVRRITGIHVLKKREPVAPKPSPQEVAPMTGNNIPANLSSMLDNINRSLTKLEERAKENDFNVYLKSSLDHTQQRLRESDDYNRKLTQDLGEDVGKKLRTLEEGLQTQEDRIAYSIDRIVTTHIEPLRNELRDSLSFGNRDPRMEEVLQEVRRLRGVVEEENEGLRRQIYTLRTSSDADAFSHEVERLRLEQEHFKRDVQREKEEWTRKVQQAEEDKRKWEEWGKAVASGSVQPGMAPPGAGPGFAMGWGGMAVQQQPANPFEHMAQIAQQAEAYKENIERMGAAFGWAPPKTEEEEGSGPSKKDEDQIDKLIGYAERARGLWSGGNAKEDDGDDEEKPRQNPLSHIPQANGAPSRVPGWSLPATPPQLPAGPQQPPASMPVPMNPAQRWNTPAPPPQPTPPGTPSPHQGWGLGQAPAPNPPAQMQAMPSAPVPQAPRAPSPFGGFPGRGGMGGGAAAALQIVQMEEQQQQAPPQQQQPVPMSPPQPQAQPAPAPSAPISLPTGAFGGAAPTAFAPTPAPPSTPTNGQPPHYAALLSRAESMITPWKDQLLEQLNNRTNPEIIGPLISAQISEADKDALYEIEIKDTVEVVRKVLGNPEAMQSRDGEQWVENLIDAIA